MIRLGHIDYTNCYPVHAALLDSSNRPNWLTVQVGSPGELNELLAAGLLDVAPCSSIEYARRFAEYRVLSGLCIGSAGPVESIRVVSRVPWPELDGKKVLLPTASATSRCLLRILLSIRYNVQPIWADFAQESEDPLGDTEVAAALLIGDTALRYRVPPGAVGTDLGGEWTEWTGLPFVYALWQVRADVSRTAEARELHRRLLDARDRAASDSEDLARGASDRYGFAPEELQNYWARLRYDFSDDMRRGLLRFYELARQAGLIGSVPQLRMIPAPD